MIYYGWNFNHSDSVEKMVKVNFSESLMNDTDALAPNFDLWVPNEWERCFGTQLEEFRNELLEPEDALFLWSLMIETLIIPV